MSYTTLPNNLKGVQCLSVTNPCLQMKAVKNARIRVVAVHYLKTSALTTALAAIRFFTSMKRLLKKATMMSKFNEPTDPPVFKSQQEFYDWLRNKVIDEVTVEIQKMQGFGKDTLDSLCVYVQGMKK
jgi:hypothetical protein